MFSVRVASRRATACRRRPRPYSRGSIRGRLAGSPSRERRCPWSRVPPPEARSGAGGSRPRVSAFGCSGSPVTRSGTPANETRSSSSALPLHDVAHADEAGDELRARPVVDLLRRAGLLDLAGIHHADQVGGGHRLGLVVGDVDRGVADRRRAGGAPRSASPRAGWRRGWTAARRAAGSPGSTISARASATRCCWPPDSSPG